MVEPGTSTWRGITWQGFTKVKEEAEGFLASAYVPEFDEAVEAGKILRDFGIFRGTASVARRNRLLRTMLHAVYANLGGRVVGLAPEVVFFAPILAMAGRGNVAVLPGEGMVLGRMVETGESRTPRPKGPLTRYTTSLSDALSLAAQGLPPTKSPRGQPISLRQPLLASGLPHPGLMAPASLPPGIVESRR